MPKDPILFSYISSKVLKLGPSRFELSQSHQFSLQSQNSFKNIENFDEKSKTIK